MHACHPAQKIIFLKNPRCVCDQQKFAILTNLLIRICLSQITTFMNFKACKPTDTVTRLLCHKDLSEDRYLTKKQKQKKNIHFRTIELEELKCEH